MKKNDVTAFPFDIIDEENVANSEFYLAIQPGHEGKYDQILTGRTHVAWDKPGCPSIDVVQACTHRIIASKFPEYLTTDLEKTFESQGYDIIYTPPYCPKFQPIERVWGWSKNYVSEVWYEGRTLTETFAQMMSVWYGGDVLKPDEEGRKTPYFDRMGGLRPDLCQSVFKQCEKHMDEWIEELGLRCVGKITDNTFHYHANIAYPDDGSIVDGDVDVDFDFDT